MEPIRTDLQYFEPTHTIHTSFTERTDAIVPDAEPDIGRILCAYASVSVKDELPQNDRILLSGTVNAVVLFRPDGQDTIRFLQIPQIKRVAILPEGIAVTFDSADLANEDEGSERAVLLPDARIRPALSPRLPRR